MVSRRSRQAHLAGDVGDLGQRPFEVLGDVDGQRLERRHVDHSGARVGSPAAWVEVEPVDAHEEPGERFARPGGRGDQGVAGRRNMRPALELRRRWSLGEGLGKPPRDCWVKAHPWHQIGDGLDSVELQRVEELNVEHWLVGEGGEFECASH